MQGVGGFFALNMKQISALPSYYKRFNTGKGEILPCVGCNLLPFRLTLVTRYIRITLYFTVTIDKTPIPTEIEPPPAFPQMLSAKSCPSLKGGNHPHPLSPLPCSLLPPSQSKNVVLRE